jgi:hypothetical protein
MYSEELKAPSALAFGITLDFNESATRTNALRMKRINFQTATGIIEILLIRETDGIRKKSTGKKRTALY